MTFRATILGCGSSTGVPRVALGWGDCDPNNPKNRRRRCSLLVERANAARGRTCVLVDTSPDLREQLLDAAVEWLDAVLYTHDHADHTHSIDDLRPMALKKRQRIDVHADEPTSQTLLGRFGYCFATPPGSNTRQSLTCIGSTPAARSRSTAAAARSSRCRSARSTAKSRRSGSGSAI